jgi:hypothetical protein
MPPFRASAASRCWSDAFWASVGRCRRSDAIRSLCRFCTGSTIRRWKHVNAGAGARCCAIPGRGRLLGGWRRGVFLMGAMLVLTGLTTVVTETLRAHGSGGQDPAYAHHRRRLAGDRKLSLFRCVVVGGRMPAQRLAPQLALSVFRSPSCLNGLSASVASIGRHSLFIWLLDVRLCQPRLASCSARRSRAARLRPASPIGGGADDGRGCGAG